jgi:hypothetical protein
VFTEHPEGKKLSVGVEAIYAPSTNAAMTFLEPISKLVLTAVNWD